MGKFDFLDDLGASKENYTKINLEKGVEGRIVELEMLVSRLLMPPKFKEELIEAMISKKITKDVYEREKMKSISHCEKIEIILIGIEKTFLNNNKNDFFYVGSFNKGIDILPGWRNVGKTTVNFLECLFSQLEGRTLTIRECNSLSDILGINLFKCFEIEQLTK